jgi:prepilin-type N-terminal cleavage/methylation domain-containing protein
MGTKPSFKKAFTLIELMVVIAIIGLLLALILPALSRSQARARRTTCLNNLKQINLGLRMYCDDAKDTIPGQGGATTQNFSVFLRYKELMKNYVGLNGASSPQDKLFACPADTFYYNYYKTNRPAPYVSESLCSLSNHDFSSYSLNAGNLTPPASVTNFARPGIGDLKFTDVQHPARTLLLFESPAFIPYSWHEPKRPFSAPNSIFDGSQDMVSFVDGHLSFIKMYWQSTSSTSLAGDYDPPAGYDYQWSGS